MLGAKFVQVLEESLLDVQLLRCRLLDDFGLLHAINVRAERHSVHDSPVEVFDGLRPIGVLLAQNLAHVVRDFLLSGVETWLVGVVECNVHATLGGDLRNAGADLAGANDRHIVDSVADLGGRTGRTNRLPKHVCVGAPLCKFDLRL